MIYDLAKEQFITVLAMAASKKVINNCLAVNTKELAERANNMVLHSRKHWKICKLLSGMHIQF